MKIKRILYFLVFALFFINNVNAEVIIYDNLTTSNYNYIIINDDLNIKYLNEFNYDVLFNNSYYGSFHKGEKIFYPNNETIITLYPQNTINTDVTTAYDVAKPSLIIVFGFLVGSGLFIFIGFWLWKQFKKR